MPDVRDIRSFFKPAERPSERLTPPRATTPTTVRVWPSPRLPTRQRDAPSGSGTATATANPIPPNRPPTNSQSSANSTASKKALLNGNIVILNSDSDSEPDLFEELDFGLSKPPPQKVTLNSHGNPEHRHGAYSTPSVLLKKDDELKKPPKPTQTSVSTLNRLVKEAQKSAEEEQRMKSLWADLEKPVESTIEEQLAIDEDVLAGIVHDDDDGDDKAKRLYLAMQRTNALDTDCVFHLFGDSKREATRSMKFPAHALSSCGWTACLEDPLQRDQAFLSGFAQQVFQYQTLPPELAAWMVDQICAGSIHSLSVVYMQLLESHPEHLKTYLSKAQLEKIFSGLGASIEKHEQDIRPIFELPHSSKRSLPSHLKSVLELVRCAAKCLSPEPRKYALSILLLMSMDASVISDASTLLLLQDTLESLIRHIPDRDPMLTNLTTALVRRLTHPILQNTLITHLPTKSPLSATFRRHLALSFLLGPATPIPASLSETDFSHLIHTYLSTDPALKITRHTDYASLAATISLLDVAIGTGPLPVPCQPPAPPQRDSNSIPSSTSAATWRFKGPSRSVLTAEEISFNKVIDGLVQSIKLLGNGIVEAGAISDLSRLEAKDGLERLVRRLESAVRIGGRRKRAVFEVDEEDWVGEGEGEMEKKRRVVERWFGGRMKDGGGGDGCGGGEG
ncbi:uncharacterized protein EI97DRAFT_454779 [Westerdykella ornata]|uniref:Uncharacterized protein n=1 Tax=Westerdykella ornata TaxID=318751 RepID=A0A6A6JYE4_WESOR|nr:uncharacterized protein EI97DRAFT_454779 [Westerdykella ornata]KAF2281612.1 hypothetical protein EI97DRAFT_454779 [Westerdykella ornata]